MMWHIRISSLNHYDVTVPWLGYSQADAPGSYEAKWAMAADQTVSNSPCAADDEDFSYCYRQMMRLTYLNQQSDGGMLALRRGDQCLTEDELDDINNKNERENHPLNCAKINAKGYPYFDGGPMTLKQGGQFKFMSTRNNNFSNRDMTGLICVSGTNDDGEREECKLDGNGVLQDTNPMLSVSEIKRAEPEQAPSKCNEEASQDKFANNFGAASCIENADPVSDILTGPTQTIEQKDNDAIGAGNKAPCDEIFWFYKNLSRVEQAIVLAIVLTSTGICCMAIGNYFYNMYFRIQGKGKAFDPNSDDWKKAHETGKDREVI